MEVERFTYAHVWQRFAATAIDACVHMALVALGSLALKTSSFLGVFFAYAIMSGLYTPAMHARYGQTLGKMALGIHVRQLDGQPIRWTHAFARSSIDLATQAVHLAVLGAAWADGAISGGPFESFVAFGAATEAMELPMLDVFSTVWFYSELVTMLFNKQRRALHDYLGGTVVLRRLPSTDA